MSEQDQAQARAQAESIVGEWTLIHYGNTGMTRHNAERLIDAVAAALAAARAEGARAAFRAGFMATVPSAGRGIGWAFDGPAAANREPEAWEAWQAIRARAGETAPKEQE